METKKVIIGIVAKHYRKDYMRLETFIRDEVEQAIFDNGAIAIGILPPNVDKIHAKDKWYEQLTTEEKHNFYDQINLCDGIILQGGGFIDEYECFIAKYCYDYDIPILGICAGKHCLVRGVGGCIGRLTGDSHEKNDEYVHSIKLSENSLIYKIIGKEEIMVNSCHKGYSTDLNTLKCTAYAPDGIDEVVEADNRTFYMGVQFHPESLYKHDENMNKIFQEFIRIAGSKKK